MASFFDEESSVEPLVICQNEEYKVCDDTVRWIEEHDKPIVFVACAGKYRTGKSFLLNRLASAKGGCGFGVGNSVQACTKGLWVYKEFFPSPDGTKSMILIDTEGIDALDANDTHDVRIFTLALLLSSAFLYNSVGAIDETAMQTLSLMARVTENVRAASGESQVAEHMPYFCWVLRDFGLQLVDKGGNTITPDEYLEEALHTEDRHKGQVRDVIRDSFPQRTLVTLPRPSSGEDRALEDRLFSITPRFQTAVSELRGRLFNEVRPFEANGRVVSGRMYGELCRHLVGVVQTGAVPVMRDSWTLLASVHARDLRDELMRRFEQQVDEMTPMRREAVETALASEVAHALADFDARAMQPVDDEVRVDLQAQLQAKSAEATERLGLDVARIAQAKLDAFEGAREDPDDYSAAFDDLDALFTVADGRDHPSALAEWRTILHERIASRWFPRVTHQLQLSKQTCDDLLRSNAEVAELTRASCERAWAMERDELRLRVASVDERLSASEQEREAQLERCASLEARVNLLVRQLDEALDEATTAQDVETRSSLADGEVPDDDGGDDLDVQHALRMANVELQTCLDKARAEASAAQSEAAEARERLEVAMGTHARLEANWNDGLAELKAKGVEARAAMEERCAQMQGEADALRTQLTATKLELDERVSEAARAADAHAREKSKLDEALSRCREECEASQNRVLDVHKHHLDDLRTRDERMREQHDTNIKERTAMTVANSELSRDNERLRESVTTLKRKVTELEPNERECKRLRQTQQEESLKLARFETETHTLRTQLEAISEERERLRQQNIQMEGQLAVLRAEKQLADARKSIGQQAEK